MHVIPAATANANTHTHTDFGDYTFLPGQTKQLKTLLNLHFRRLFPVYSSQVTFIYKAHMK